MEAEKLVQQVIVENPVEEKGERDEWADHVGWHRTEDIHGVGGREGGGRGGGLRRRPIPIPIKSDSLLPTSLVGIKEERGLFSPPQNTLPLLVFLIFSLLACIGCRWRRGGKTRTQ